ncbi:MAG: TfoX/Sxy family protein [Chloroflexi bacterium]|nr:TfoX/Sxy family protein [Chloroflexota bacterium]
MAYDERLAERVRAVLGGRDDLREQKMFGGVAFMVGDKMCVGVTNDDLMVRLGAGEQKDALKRPHVRPMDFTGRPMKGFIFVGAEGVKTKRQVQTWVDRALAYRSMLG